MTRPLYAMDTFFTTSMGRYPMATACGMVADLGFHGLHYSYMAPERSPRELPAVVSACADTGLELMAVGINLNGAVAADHPARRLADSALEVHPEGVPLDIGFWELPGGLQPSDPSGDAIAIEMLAPYLDMAERRGVPFVNLYPHEVFWMETPDDAVRLVAAIDHPLLRVGFNGFHWYHHGCRDLGASLDAIGDRLGLVNISGVRMGIDMVLGATLEPIDQGEFDPFRFAATLEQRGLHGPLGFQGYGIGGDVYANLRRCVDAWRDIEDRLQTHPDWAAAMAQ